MKVVTGTGALELGTTEATPTIGITDYSRRDTDAFGVTTVVKRGFSRRMSVRLAVPTTEVDALQRRMAALRATSATWVADDRFAWLSIEGFYKDFDIDLAVPPLSFCSLTVEGLAAASGAPDPGGDPAPDDQQSTLQLLRPVTMTDAMLVASSVAENDAATWNNGATYAKGARAIRAHRIWESLIAGNVGHEPSASPAAWLDTGPTNRWAMFDQALGTATTRAGAIEVIIDAGTASSVALLDVTGASVRVQAAGYDRSTQVTAGAIVFQDLPGAGRMTVTIDGAAVAVGTLLVGNMVDLGITEAAPTAGITDYSRKETDDFGTVTIVERTWAKRMTAKALIRTEAIDIVADRIAGVRATPSLWIGQAGQDAITVYGFFKDFTIEVGENVSKLSLSIEGMSEAAPITPAFPGGTVNWPDVVDSDPARPKPTDGADKTSENTSKDTAAVGGKPAGDVLAAIDAAKTRQDKFETETLPAIDEAVADAGKRIDDAAKSLTDVAERVTTVESSSANGGNLLSNTDWAIDAAGWVFTPEDGSTGYLGSYGPDNYWPAGMLPLQIYSPNGSGNRAGHWRQTVRGIEGGAPYQGSLYVGSHRATAGLYVDCCRADGSYNGSTFQLYSGRFNTGTRSLKDDYERIVLNFTPPADTAILQFYLLKNGTLPGFDDSYTWFLRPQLVKLRKGVTEGVPYTPGSADASQAALNAKVATIEKAGNDGRVALASRLTSVEASAAAARSSVNPNPDFSAWSNPDATPDRWAYWNVTDKVAQIGSPLNRGGYGVKQVPTDLNSGIYTDNIYVPAGRYFMEVTVYKLSGSWRGAGITLSGERSIWFASTPDIAGVAGDSAEPVRTWSVPIDVKPGTDCPPGYKNWHCMSNWVGFGDGFWAKELWWLENRLRPASDAESAVPALAARAKVTEDALADLPNQYATAKRAIDLEAQLNGTADSNLLARANQQATVIADGKAGAVANDLSTLSGEYNGTKGEVSRQAGVIVNLEGKASAYVKLVADAGNGRAALSLWSDQFGGAWSLTGDGLIDGNLTINGTLKARAFDRSSMSRDGRVEWNGNVSPSVGQTINLPGLGLPTIPPLGRFIYEVVVVVQTNAGTRTTTNMNGKPAYLDYLRDGGVLMRAIDDQGNAYTPRTNNLSDTVIAATDFNPNFAVTISRGSQDTGWVDQGDYYSRQMSGTYTVTSYSLRATWVAI